MHTLFINANLKYIEFLLHAVDIADNSKTVGEIKKDFTDKFRIKMPHMLNQYFGIIRLLPLLLMRERLKEEGKKYDPRISIIRHALAHNNFTVNEAGYEFKSNIGDCKMTRSEFTWLIENEFYTGNSC